MLTVRCTQIATKFYTTRGGVANVAFAGEGSQKSMAATQEVKFRGGWISDRGGGVQSWIWPARVLQAESRLPRAARRRPAARGVAPWLEMFSFARFTLLPGGQIVDK
eukprot:11175282-Lingulodinium_polyedra.AAC.1